MDGILRLSRNPLIKGFTTNPTLMRKAGITDYVAFAREVLDVIQDRPISFEAFADDEIELERQARAIAAWGDNVYVKIPVTTTHGESMSSLVARLSQDGVRVNVTGLMTQQQVAAMADALAGGSPACISVFAGRIADTGRDPVPLMTEAVAILATASTDRADLGESARAAQRFPRGFRWMPHHHRDPRHPSKARNSSVRISTRIRWKP